MGPAEQAKALRAELGLPEGKVDLELVCRKLHIRQFVSDSPSYRLGTPCFICPRRGGFVIIWARDTHRIPQGKRRFIIGHEIGHTFFYPRRSERNVPRRRFEDDHPNAAEERWCDAFARALLRDDPGVRKIEAAFERKRKLRELTVSRKADRRIRKVLREMRRPT